MQVNNSNLKSFSEYSGPGFKRFLWKLNVLLADKNINN
jgi:hypothetical protein